MTNDQPKILIITDPPAAPGYLPRVRSLCEFLVQKGCNVTLLTEEYQPLDFAHNYPIVTVPMYSGRGFDWFVKTVWTLLTDWHNRAFAKKYLSSNSVSGLTSNSEAVFDYVICSAFSDFPLGAAKRIAEHYHVPLICDIRDLDEQVEDSRYQYKHKQRWLMAFRRLYRAIHIRRRNNVLRAANQITTVSPWHADFIRTITDNRSPTTVIYNGFDEKQFYPQNTPAKEFTVTYIGSLFEWQLPALQKVKQAIEELNQSSIILDIHTPQSRPIAHNQLGDAIRKSGIMLVLTSPDTHGMLTTKFYEALGCEKPILCVPSDKGSLAELMAYTNAGLATDDIETIKAFIATKYQEWQQDGFTRQATQHREQFVRQALYDQYYRTCL